MSCFRWASWRWSTSQVSSWRRHRSSHKLVPLSGKIYKLKKSDSSETSFFRTSLVRGLVLAKFLTLFPITHQPFKMLLKIQTKKPPRKPISGRSWVSFFLVFRTSSVLSCSSEWPGLLARVVPSRASLLYLSAAAL